MRLGRVLCALWVLSVLPWCCSAETRWCSILAKDGSAGKTGDSAKVAGYKLLYPPIARAARLRGVVISRIIYRPSGQVVGVETISGPPMLTYTVERQVKDWTIRTDATGTENCQSLLIAEFTMGDDPVGAASDSTGTTLRIEVHTEPMPMTTTNSSISNKR
jgi:hypothetical protein